MDRRCFLQGVAVGASATSAAARADARETNTAVAAAQSPQALAADGSDRRASSQVAPAPWWLLVPYGPQDEIALGWHVASLSPVEQGRTVLTLRRGAQPVAGADEVEVSICLHGGAPKGVAHTARLDLVLMNDGEGKVKTDEAVGRVLETLSWAIRDNTAGRELPAGLLTHSVRVGWYGSPRR